MYQATLEGWFAAVSSSKFLFHRTTRSKFVIKEIRSAVESKETQEHMLMVISWIADGWCYPFTMNWGILKSNQLSSCVSIFVYVFIYIYIKHYINMYWWFLLAAFPYLHVGVVGFYVGSVSPVLTPLLPLPLMPLLILIATTEVQNARCNSQMRTIYASDSCKWQL